ncbi:MAG: diaminopimelate decarboxylase [Alloprevotella sp.]|nr:diaminopimelate decarboxylase [Alloprevotella sp.]
MNINLEHLQAHETPFYYYDTQVLRTTLAALNAACAGEAHIHPHYAVKANARPELLRIIAGEGLGADCVSGGEIRAALDAGFPAGSIVFAGVGKADWELRLALQAGIGMFNVESLPELERISELAVEAGVTARVALRINPNVDAHTHEKITTGLNENKFGLAMEDMVPAVRMVESLPNVSYEGLHFHIGSSILDLSVFARLCERINELQDVLEREGIVTRNINVGGGLGTHYEDPDVHPIPDFIGYLDTFRKYLRLRPGQQLHIEPGRSIVAQCGMLVSRVLYVKAGHEKQFLILDAGFTDLIRPALYNAHHLIQNLSAQGAEATEHYDVVGPICESSDVFQTAAPLPPSKRGDLIAFRTAGAYGEIMASQYNLRRLPGAVFNGLLKS